MKNILHAMVLIFWFEADFVYGKVCLTSTGFACDPTEDCANSGPDPGSLVPDPTDCTKYFVCIPGPSGTLIPSGAPQACSTGKYFNPETCDCNSDTCSNLCNIISPPNQCNITCPSYDPNIGATVIADKSNCTVFYTCLLSGPLRRSCSPQTPFFNGKSCVADEEECCASACVPQCTPGEYVQIQNPCDCTTYFLCFDGQMSDKNECDPGYYYNTEAVGCVFGPCSSLCSGEACVNAGTVESTLTPTTTTTQSGQPTSIAPTSGVPTSGPPTSGPPTSGPPTSGPPTSGPPTSGPPTSAPPTSGPPTSGPPTSGPPTSGPPTSGPPTSGPPTAGPPTSAPTTTRASEPTTKPTPLGCQEIGSFTCPSSDGNFPRCDECNQSYVICAGGVPSVGYCNGNAVYNTNPDYPYCLSPSNCPYPPNIY